MCFGLGTHFFLSALLILVSSTDHCRAEMCHQSSVSAYLLFQDVHRRLLKEMLREIPRKVVQHFFSTLCNTLGALSRKDYPTAPHFSELCIPKSRSSKTCYRGRVHSGPDYCHTVPRNQWRRTGTNG